jgi:hypothetical protein
MTNLKPAIALGFSIISAFGVAADYSEPVAG